MYDHCFRACAPNNIGATCHDRTRCHRIAVARRHNPGTATQRTIMMAHGAEPAAPPPMPAPSMPPAGDYHLDKSHASLVMRVNHLGF